MHAESVGSFILVDSLADFIFVVKQEILIVSPVRASQRLLELAGEGSFGSQRCIHAANCFRISWA